MDDLVWVDEYKAPFGYALLFGKRAHITKGVAIIFRDDALDDIEVPFSVDIWGFDGSFVVVASNNCIERHNTLQDAYGYAIALLEKQIAERPIPHIYKNGVLGA